MRRIVAVTVSTSPMLPSQRTRTLWLVGLSDDDESARARQALARNVEAARHRKGMTQAELASASGIAQQRISAIELASENVTLRTLSKIAAALGVEPGTLLR